MTLKWLGKMGSTGSEIKEDVCGFAAEKGVK